jgi:hypothetical protein
MVAHFVLNEQISHNKTSLLKMMLLQGNDFLKVKAMNIFKGK